MIIRDLWEYPDHIIGRQVLVYSQTDSTNNRALAHAGSGSQGLAFLADEQTAGRGTQGRRWAASPGQSVLLTVLLAPPEALRRAEILTAWAAVAVVDCVRSLVSESRQLRIKWPNDVLLNHSKIAGILIESAGMEFVAGIGLNVRQSAEDWHQQGINATSLNMAGVAIETEAVARRLLECLDTWYVRLLAGEVAALEQRWVADLDLIGRRVRVTTPQGESEAVVRRLTFREVEFHPGGTWSPAQVRLDLLESGQPPLAGPRG
jgi:BirA family biotin operon repressor/biotin-[acetyl-CoA-carboxylase] ligase